MFTRLSSLILTDLYELTMAAAYWKEKKADELACFHLFFRKLPFHGEYVIFAGLQRIIERLNSFQISKDEIEYLRSLRTDANTPLFEKDFLKYLSKLRFTCDVDAVREGEVVFSFEPLVRLTGPLLQCQLLESILLNELNFASLVATKASHICHAAGQNPVIEFGLRRAQGPDASMIAARSSFIGGCESTSNTLAGMVYGIPVVGTMAHSWIMAYDRQIDAFHGFAHAQEDQVFLLVDTYDTIQGVKDAIIVGKELQKKGKKLRGIRLDSGDMVELSKKSRALLNEASFFDTKIVASNELDEHKIFDLKKRGAQIDIWGVGTNLVTGRPEAALDGVYKLSALYKEKWKKKVKLSEELVKISDPGILQVRRVFQAKKAVGDVIVEEGKIHNMVGYSLFQDKVQDFSHMESEPLLIPIFRKGELVYRTPPLIDIQKFRAERLKMFPEELKHIEFPEPFFVSRDSLLSDVKEELIQELKRTECKHFLS